jgi:hypothetical protein
MKKAIVALARRLAVICERNGALSASEVQAA